MSDNYQIRDGNGSLRTFRATENPDLTLTTHHNIDVLPAQHVDAFSRIRTSAPGYRFDSQLTYQIDSDLWDVDDNSGNGSVTHSATERWALLSADASVAGNKVILQSHYHAPYTPGRGQAAFITFLLGSTPESGGARRVGYWDGANGIYLEQNSSEVKLVIDSGTSSGAESVLQTNWNLDPMDGTGPSGVTLDLTKTQILVIQMQALYVGRVTVGFDIGGQIIPVHHFDCANEAAYPYIQQASLPVRYEVEADSTTGAMTMAAICASVFSEGGGSIGEMPGRSFVATGSLDNTASGTLLVIRCKQTLNSIDQNAVVVPIHAMVATEDQGAWFELRLNATVTAGTFEDIHSGSVMEVSYAGNSGTDPTVTAGTGTLIDRGYVPASNTASGAGQASILGKIVMAYSHLLGAGDTLSVLFDGGGATTDARGSVAWKEIR